MTTHVDKLRGRVSNLVFAALIQKMPPDHDEPESATGRRRVIALITLAVGATLLGLSLSTRVGDSRFYWLTSALALTWLVGGLASGPLHLGSERSGGTVRRPILTPIAIGLATAAVFVLGAVVVRDIEPLRQLMDRVLQHARTGSLPLTMVLTVANGAAEEVFFRGTLFAAAGRSHPVATSTGVYALVTVATANPMLIFSAVVLGTVLGLQRRASGGVLAPMLTHITWSMVMLFALTPLVN